MKVFIVFQGRLIKCSWYILRILCNSRTGCWTSHRPFKIGGKFAVRKGFSNKLYVKIALTTPPFHHHWRPSRLGSLTRFLQRFISIVRAVQLLRNHAHSCAIICAATSKLPTILRTLLHESLLTHPTPLRTTQHCRRSVALSLRRSRSTSHIHRLLSSIYWNYIATMCALLRPL